MTSGYKFAAFCRVAFVGFVGACASSPDQPDPLTALADDGDREKVAAPTEADLGKADAELGQGEKTIPFGKGMTRPYQVSGPAPSLPPAAIANHVTGMWIARCAMTETGDIEDCKIIKGLRDSNAHLLHIIKAQKYTPVMYEGRPQRVFYTFKITFK